MFSFVQFSKHRPVVPLGLLPTQLCVRKLEQPPPAFDSRFMRQHSRQGQPAKFASWKPNLSLENLDWLSSFWNFCQRPVSSTDCCAGAAKSKAPEEAAKDPLYGVRPRSSNKDPARHIAIFFPSYRAQPSTLSSAMNVVTFTSAMPAFCQERNKGTRSRFFLSRRVGAPEITYLNTIYIYI